MNNKVKILLGSEKNINSVNVDNFSKIELNKKENRITEFTVNDVVNSSELFDEERANNPVYRIYGRIEYLSLLNGLKKSYDKLEDFFYPQKYGDVKDIFNSFDFYLVAPTSASNANYLNINNTNKYKRNFVVIADKDDFELYEAGFSNNVYADQVYIFSFKVDFDVSNLYDAFGFPLTELFLYAQYKKDSSKNESMSFIKWSTSTGNKTQSLLTINSFNIGDVIKNTSDYNINDVIEYNKEEFLQEQVDTQKYYIRTKYKNESNITKTLEWSYNPFIPFRLRYFNSVLSTDKLSNIVEDSVNLNIEEVNDSTISIDLSKSLKQNLSTSNKTITNWDNQTSSDFDFNSETGVLKFLKSGTYKINFNTKIYLSERTDKYIAKTMMLISSNGSSWTPIPKTSTLYYENNEINGFVITKNISSGQYIKLLVMLVPNPDERKLKIIPDYATIIENSGKYVWRDIVRQGYVEPISDVGVDYPFFNGKRYLFSPITFSVVPNLSTETFDKHQHTINVFSEISYSDNAITIDKNPITELDDIGKPCL